MQKDSANVTREAATEDSRAGSPWPSAVTASEDGPGRTLVLGLGNDILRDDAVGLHVAGAVRSRLGVNAPVDVIEVCEMGLALLDLIVGYERLLIVDSVQTGQAPPGTIHIFDGNQVKTRRNGAPHFLGVGETLALGRHLGLEMPERVVVVAVEVEDPFTLGTELTPAVVQAVEPTVATVLAQLGMSQAPAG
ncbi:MAG: hydrogenase maturation protease [Verrucomicrobiales bacterium]|nr:hydrogenase maturation protease [Verrucomicrobiales bacterium]